jgi:hypothetical protein
MKTAMQELQEWMTENHFKVTLGFLDQIEYCKQKEKEQIIADFEAGYKSCDLDEAFEINRKLSNGELYYKKTYGKA